MTYFHTSLLCLCRHALQKDRIFIKRAYLLKGNIAQELLKEYLSKCWNKRRLQRLLKENLRHQLIWQASRELKTSTAYCREGDPVGYLMFSQEGASQVHQSVYKISRS